MSMWGVATAMVYFGFVKLGMSLPPPIAQLLNVDEGSNLYLHHAIQMSHAIVGHVCGPVMGTLFDECVEDVEYVPHSSFVLFVYGCLLHVNSMVVHMTL